MAFMPGRQLQQGKTGSSRWLIVDSGRILIRRGDAGVSFPETEDRRSLGLKNAPGPAIGETEDGAYFLEHGDALAPVPEGFEWMELRALFGSLDDELFWIAGRANHLAGWDRTHRFCGACGADLALQEDAWAKRCPSCDQTYYPQIAPAVIVSVVDGDRILLARNCHYRYPFFTVLAGFVEAGEDLESAVHREILEEVGISVKNLRYFGSQPWPFPNSLMIGFTAEYAGGELRPDPREILEAAWFTRETMPEGPSSISIARRLIEAFVDGGVRRA